MRKVLILLMLSAAVSVSAFATNDSTVKKDFVLKNEGGLVMSGVVKSTLPADLTRPRSGLVITDAEGKDVEFAVKALAVIYNGADGKILSLTQLQAGQKVQVSYRMRDGAYEASAVKILPSAEAPQAEGPELKETMPQDDRSIK